MTTQAQVQGLGEFARFGFTLEPHGDDIVLLLHENKVVAQFSQTGATEQSLQADCAKHLGIPQIEDTKCLTRKEAE